MSLFDSPTPPDPKQTADAQSKYNLNSGIQQQRLNMVNQSNPFGALNYNQSGTDTNGVPIFSADTTLSSPVQQLLNTQFGLQNKLGATQGNLADTAHNLATNFGSTWANGPNLDPSAITNKMMGWGHDYMQPIFDMQQKALDAKLASQGITPGSEAYTNANRDQSRNVNDAYTNLFMQSEPMAFNQEVQKYQMPLTTLSTLLGASVPQAAPQPNFMNTPQAQIGAPDYTGAVQSNYAQQTAQHNAMLGGLFGLAGNVAGGWAKGGMPNPFSAGPTSMGGMM